VTAINSQPGRYCLPQSFVAPSEALPFGRDLHREHAMAVLHNDWGDESNPIRVIDALVDALDLADLGFDGVEPETTGLPAYHPSTRLMLYI
jgi:hypothetical protein